MQELPPGIFPPFYHHLLLVRTRWLHLVNRTNHGGITGLASFMLFGEPDKPVPIFFTLTVRRGFEDQSSEGF
jgi:hypothetical protein